MADPTVLGQLVLDANTFTVQLFGPFQEAAPGGTFARLLDQGVSAADLLAWFKDYWNGIRLLGYSEFSINIQMHDSNATLERYLVGRSQGKVYGSPVEETSDDRKRHIRILQQMAAQAEAEVARGTLAYEDTNLEQIYKMLANLATRPLFRQGA